MKDKISIKKNFIGNIFYVFFSMGSGLITAPYISRVLNPDIIGLYGYLSSIQGYFILVAALGTATYGSREISRLRDNKYEYSKTFWEIEALSVITTLIVSFIWLCLAWADPERKIYYLLLMPTLLATALDISWLFYGLERMTLIVKFSTLSRILVMLSIFVFVRKSEDIYVYFFIQSSMSFISNLFLWSSVRGIVTPTKLQLSNIIKHFKPTLGYFLPTIASSIYLMLDKTLVGGLTRQMSEVGFYVQAERIISLLKSILFMTLNTTVGTRVSYLYKEQKFEDIEKFLESSFNYIAVIGIYSIFSLWGLSKYLIPVFYGSGYEESIAILNGLLPVILFTAVSSVLNSQYYIPVGRRMECTKYIVIGAIINLMLNLLLIPQYQVMGAVISIVLTEFIIAYFFFKNGPMFISLRMIGKIGFKKIVAALGMTWILSILEYGILNIIDNQLYLLIILGGTSLVIYILLLILLKDQWVINMIRRFCQ